MAVTQRESVFISRKVWLWNMIWALRREQGSPAEQGEPAATSLLPHLVCFNASLSKPFLWTLVSGSPEKEDVEYKTSKTSRDRIFYFRTRVKWKWASGVRLLVWFDLGLGFAVQFQVRLTMSMNSGQCSLDLSYLFPVILVELRAAHVKKLFWNIQVWKNIFA